jgi:hypothetical protein
MLTVLAFAVVTALVAYVLHRNVMKYVLLGAVTGFVCSVFASFFFPVEYRLSEKYTLAEVALDTKGRSVYVSCDRSGGFNICVYNTITDGALKAEQIEAEAFSIRVLAVGDSNPQFQIADPQFTNQWYSLLGMWPIGFPHFEFVIPKDGFLQS